MKAAHRFLREHYIAEFNARFQVPAAERGSAFVRRSSRDLDLIFALQFQRTVNRDNTVSIQNLRLQIEAVRWRAPWPGARSLCISTWTELSPLLTVPCVWGTTVPTECHYRTTKSARVELWKGRRQKSQKKTFPPGLEIPPTPRDSHFPQLRRRQINPSRTFHLLKNRTF